MFLFFGWLLHKKNEPTMESVAGVYHRDTLLQASTLSALPELKLNRDGSYALYLIYSGNLKTVRVMYGTWSIKNGKVTTSAPNNPNIPLCFTYKVYPTYLIKVSGKPPYDERWSKLDEIGFPMK